MNKQKLKSCPFCGAKPIEIVFDTHKSGRPAGYVLKIEHQAQCFIEHMSYAYYGTPEYCEKDWNRRLSDD